MVCSDISRGDAVPMKAQGLSSIEKRLSSLSPSEREHVLESVAYHKEMLVELAKM
jgi:hypothetical protein